MEFMSAVCGALRRLSVRNSQLSHARFKTGTTGLVFALTLAAALGATDAGATNAAAVGVLAGKSGVSPSGAATYNIPISMPPGTHGMQPSLALSYDSQGVDGWAGYGWTLSGLSTITRCAATIEDDGLTQGVRYITNSSYSDDFCLDGQRLRLTGVSYYGGDGSTYGTEIEGFAVITAHVDSSATQGPSWFTVQTKDGRTYEYGHTTDSKIVAYGTTVVRTWALDKVTDLNGNYMSYQYSGNTHAGLEYWPTDIYYTGNGTTINPDHQIHFDFENRPSDVRNWFTAGSVAQNSMRLHDIKIIYGGASTPTFTYSLNYSQDAANGRNLLSNVQECGSDGSCLPATTIAWTGGSPGEMGWGNDQSTGITVPDANHANAAHLMDVDGDGIDDLVYPGATDWMVAFGLPGGGFTTPVDTGDQLWAGATYYKYALAMDYDGSGRTALAVPVPVNNGWLVLVPTGNRTAGQGGIFRSPPNAIPNTNSINSVTNQPIYMGNVWMASSAGNGLSDMYYNTGSTLQLQQNEGPSTGGSNGNLFTTATVVASGNTLQDLTDQDFAGVGLDFDGSGRIGALSYNGAGGWFAYAPTGVGSASALAQIGGGISGQGVPAVPADFNGDGLTDLLTVNTAGQWQVSISTGTDFVTQPTNDWYIASAYDPVVADYYGNGTQVAIVYAQTAGNVNGWNMISSAYSATGGNFSTNYASTFAPYPMANFLSGSLRVAHIDASGMDDLVYATGTAAAGYTFHYELHSGANAPTYPDLVSQVTDGLGNYCVFQYASLAEGGLYSENIQNDPATYPIENIQPAMQVVGAYTESNGIGGAYTINYSYSGAQFDLLGRGFLGFYNIVTTDTRNSNEEWTYYDQTFPWIGEVINDTTYAISGGQLNPLHAMNATPDQVIFGSGYQTRYMPYNNATVVHSYDPASVANGTVGAEISRIATSYDLSTSGHLSSGSFDNFGNVLHSTTQVFDEFDPSSPTFTTTTTSTYNTSNTNNNNCVSLPTSVTVTKTRLASTATRTTTIPNPDTVHCQLAPSNSASSPSVTETNSSDSMTLSQSYSYDGFGNVSGTVVSGTGISSTLSTGGRTNGMSFSSYCPSSGLSAAISPNGEFAVQSTTQVSGSLTLCSSSAWRYDLGVQTQSVDPNGLVTSMQYDPYGRPIQVTRPDGTATTWTYQWCNNGPTFACPSGAIYEVVTGQINSGATSTITTGYTAYDTFGRVVEQGKKLLGGVISLVDTSYNAYGAVSTVTDPYLATQSPTIYTNLYCYYAANGARFVSYEPASASDGCGAVTGATGSQVVSTYSYNAFTSSTSRQAGVFGDLKDGTTQNTSSTTDALGEVTQVTDAKGGKTTYSYDAFGDLIGTVDADTKSTTISYDGLGHKTGMVDPNMGTWTYQVDALGEVLCQQDAKNQYIIMSYDNVGRLSSKLETAAGAGCTASSGYTGTWTYDNTGALGLPATVSDSNGFQRSYGYDGLTRPSDVTTTIGGTPYDVSTSYDSFGRVATVTYPVSVTPAAGGSAPTASAVATPSTVNTGVQVTLDGSASTDPNGLGLQYQWTQTGTGSPMLPVGAFDPAVAKPAFTPTVGGTYTFQLRVIDSGSGQSSPASVSVTVKPLAPTAAPTVSPNPSPSGNLTLTWNPVANVTSYNVYKSTDNVNFTQIQNVSTNTATVTGLVNGTYYFAIGSSVNGVNGDRGASSAETVLFAPGPTTQTAITLSNCISSDGLSCNGVYTLNWGLVSTATSYRIYMSTGGAYSWVDTAGNQNGKVEQATTNGTFWYYVLACNTAGCSGQSNVESVGVQFIPAPPNVTASPFNVARGGSSTLIWSAGNSTPVSYFNVRNDATNALLYSGGGTSLVVRPGAPETTYDVQSCNTSGCSGYSSVTVTVGCSTCSGIKPHGTTAPTSSSTGSPTPAPAPATSGAPVGAVIELVPPMPPLDPQPELALVAAPAPPVVSNVAATLDALNQQRQALMADQPLQPNENALQAKFDRLTGATAQTLALANPGSVPQAGTPRFASPVYQAYAGAKLQQAGGTPFRFVAQYNYDSASGALLSVSNADTGFIYWRAATTSGTAPVDAFGHIVAYVDGNNVSTVTAYDQTTGAVTGIGTGIGSSSAVQQLAYSWDSFGNLTQRCDANRGLVENFTYDGLNRLATSKVYSGGTAGSCAQGPTAGAAMGLTYDAVGNIGTRTNTGITVGTGTQNDTYAYSDPNHPYAVTGVTSISGTYAYDANGNMTSGNGRSISWNDDNLPTYIASTGTVNGNNAVTGSSTFSYGPDLQRYQQVTTDSIAGNSTTTYVGGLFEVVATSAGTQYRHNVMAGGQLVAVHTLDQSGNATTNYIHSDNLGSSDTITGDTGAVAQQMSFDAFGLRRDATTWAYDLTGAQISSLKSKTDSGFTAQEQLDSVGLVHMNGRVYDPAIARFISTDPRIPSWVNSQSYGRYNYVDNNPLSSIDPTGFDACPVPKKPKAIGSNSGGAVTYQYCGKNQHPPGTNNGTGSHTGFDGGITCSGNCGLASNDPAVIDAKQDAAAKDICGGCCELICGPVVISSSGKLVDLGAPNGDSRLNIINENDPLAFGATVFGSLNIGMGATNEVLNIGVESFLKNPLAASASDFDTALTMAGSMKGINIASKGFLFVSTAFSVFDGYQAYERQDYIGATQAGLDGVVGVAGEFGGPLGLALSAGYLGMRASGADEVAGSWLTSGNWMYNTIPAVDPHPPYPPHH